jgi:hypothetical protein
MVGPNIEDCRRIAPGEYTSGFIDRVMEPSHLYWVRVSGQTPAMVDSVHRLQPSMPPEFNNIVMVGTDYNEGMVALRYTC